MKVVIYKSYSKESTLFSNYGDDYTDVWCNFNVMKEVREMNEVDFDVLNKAVKHFNLTNKSQEYSLGLFVVADDYEIDSIISSYKIHEEKEILKAAKLEKEKKALELAKKAKAEARSYERSVKKFAKELNISEDEVRVMLANKK